MRYTYLVEVGWGEGVRGRVKLKLYQSTKPFSERKTITMSRLQGKTALITGGSRGIGAAIAERLASDGANIAITYVSSIEAADKVIATCRTQGVEAEAIKADAAIASDMVSLVDKVIQGFGRLDILVNNAGIFLMGSLEDTKDEDFDQTVNINIRAVFQVSRAAAKVMPSGSRIINIGSIYGEKIPLPNISLYTMSKFAVAGLTHAWARDLGTKGITVNCVQPGPINTDMNPADSEFANTLKSYTALGRYGKPQEIAEVVAFLAGTESAYLTGACINVDGGWNA